MIGVCSLIMMFMGNLIYDKKRKFENECAGHRIEDKWYYFLEYWINDPPSHILMLSRTVEQMSLSSMLQKDKLIFHVFLYPYTDMFWPKIIDHILLVLPKEPRAYT
jgi:hypothetical protein